jgi:hypothetical protein
MADYKFYLRQISASEIVEKLASVVAEVSSNSTVNHFTIITNTGEINFLGATAGIVASLLRERAEFRTPHSFLVERPHLDVVSGGINTNEGGYSISINTDKGFYFTLNTQGPGDRDYIKISRITDSLHRHFHLYRKESSFEAALSQGERTSLQTTQSILLDFSSQATRLAEMSASSTQKMNEAIFKKAEELEKRFEDKHRALDEGSRAKSKELDLREEAFRKEKASFDARESTVVRRDLLAKIEKILGDQKTINITPATLKKRLPVHVLCIGTMAIAVVMATAFGYKILTEAASDWHKVVPFCTGTLLFVSTAIFYLRWNDQWFEDHASAEFENRSFYLDVVRASWLAELLFEWKDKKEVPFPEQLIARYTTGMFEANKRAETTKHPFDDLKALAANVAEIKFSQKEGFSFIKKSAPDK